ncbi:MAG: TIGR04219 family outer membrane beta-barrel protein [Pseudomonadales bacterium]
MPLLYRSSQKAHKSARAKLSRNYLLSSGRFIVASSIALACSLLTSTAANAADFGGRIGYGYWSQDFGGSLNSTNQEIGQIHVTNDLGFDSENAASFYLVLEHPLGIVPNVRFQHTELESETENVLSRTITYDNVTFAADQSILSSMDLSHDDLSLYWQPVQEKQFSLGLGVTIRILDGSFSIIDVATAARARQTIDEALPLPYVQFNYKFGDTGVTFGADVQVAAFEGDKFVDSSVRLAWETKMGLGVELGYRSITFDVTDLEVDDNNGNPDEIDIDLRVEGFYLGAIYGF